MFTTAVAIDVLSVYTDENITYTKFTPKYALMKKLDKINYVIKQTYEH